MRIPYVIDNQQHRLADVLNEVLAEHTGRSLDVATAYFTVTGYGLAGQAKELIEVVRKMRAALNEPAASSYETAARVTLRRADLRLICFDFLCGG